MMESLVDLALSSAADAAVWLKKSFSSAFPVVAVVAEVAAEVEDADGAAAETKAAKSLLQGRGGGRHPNCSECHQLLIGTSNTYIIHVMLKTRFSYLALLAADEPLIPRRSASPPPPPWPTARPKRSSDDFGFAAVAFCPDLLS